MNTLNNIITFIEDKKDIIVMCSLMGITFIFLCNLLLYEQDN
jgi:hypothetical protein